MICSMCKSDVAEMHVGKKAWCVREVTDYKSKQFGTSGFPSSCTTTVQGWKFKELCTFETGICTGCVANERAHAAAIANNSKAAGDRVAKYSGIVSVTVIMAIAALWISGLRINSHITMFVPLFVAGGVSITVLLISLGVSGEAIMKLKESDSSISERLHVRIRKSEFTQTPYGHLKTSSGPPLARKGDIFIIDSEIRYRNEYDREPSADGWSYIVATWQADATATRTDPQPYDAELLRQSAKNMGFSSVDEYLESAS